MRAGRDVDLVGRAMSAGQPEGPLPRVRTLPQPQFSRSLEYGLALLQAFDLDHPTLGIAELADILGPSRSTTHRYASTLVKLGYLEQDGKRRYLLSHGATRPGMAVIDTIRLETPEALAILEELREQTHHTVSMGALDGNRVVYTHRLLAHGPGQYHADMGPGVGGHVPAHCAAIGKALLANLDEPKLRETLASLTLTREGPNTITSKRAFADELARIRLQGVAMCDEEQARGVRSIAAAIPYPTRLHPLAISITVPAERYSTEAMTALLAPHVKRAAKRIEVVNV